MKQFDCQYIPVVCPADVYAVLMRFLSVVSHAGGHACCGQSHLPFIQYSRMSLCILLNEPVSCPASVNHAFYANVVGAIKEAAINFVQLSTCGTAKYFYLNGLQPCQQ